MSSAAGAIADGLTLLEESLGPRGWRASLRLEPSSGMLDGHFAGAPVLPGIAQLVIVREGLARLAGPAGALGAIPYARFRHPVRPGDVLEVVVSRPDAAGRSSFEVRVGSAVAGSGTAATRRAAMSTTATMTTDRASPPRGAERPLPDGLVPQRGRSRLVETIVDGSPDAVACRGRVPASSAFVREGRVPTVVLLELGAQAAAVHQAVSASAPDPARPAYLVAARAVWWDPDDIAAGEPLLARARRTGQAGPLAIYDVEVSGLDAGRVLAGTLSTHAGG